MSDSFPASPAFRGGRFKSLTSISEEEEETRAAEEAPAAANVVVASNATAQPPPPLRRLSFTTKENRWKLAFRQLVFMKRMNMQFNDRAKNEIELRQQNISVGRQHETAGVGWLRKRDDDCWLAADVDM